MYDINKIQFDIVRTLNRKTRFINCRAGWGVIQ